MEALNRGWRQRIGWMTGWVHWEVRRAGRRFLRRHGSLGVGVLLCALLFALAWSAERFQAAATRAEKSRWAERADMPATAVGGELSNGRLRLEQFESHLLAPDELPSQVQDLLNLAEDQHLSAVRGEYRPQVDVQGRFLRYRISLPVRGEAQAVHRFVATALQTHKALGLESVQFQRQRIDSAELEAHIQWVILARVPEGSDGAARVPGRPQ